MVLTCRTAIYSQDGLGLGHLRRNTLIGATLLEGSTAGSVLLLADSPVAPFFRLPSRMDHVKLPSIRKIRAGYWESTSLRMEQAELLRMRADLLRETLLHFRPDLLLVDHMPGGVRGELLPALQSLQKAHPGCSVVLGLRDILDAPQVTRKVWKSEGAYEAIRRYYRRILVYGSRDVFDTCANYRLQSPSLGIDYCGYVVNQAGVTDGRRLREASAARGRFVFVSVGGGGDGQALLRTYVQAVRLLGSRAGFVSLLALGANTPPELRPELEAASRGLPVRIVPFVEDAPSHMAAADLVVCMAGYNTLSEVLYLKKKALVVPRPGPSAEQRTRARLFAQKQLIDVLDTVELTPSTLAERLIRNLERTDLPAAEGAPPFDGAREAARHLLATLVSTNTSPTTLSKDPTLKPLRNGRLSSLPAMATSRL